MGSPPQTARGAEVAPPSPRSARRRPAPTPPGGRAGVVLDLQRTRGNGFVQRLLTEPRERRQGDLTGNGARDRYQPPADLGQQISAEKGKGTALPPAAMAAEPGLSTASPSRPIRVHTGGRADDLARASGSQAFAAGADIFFRSGGPEQPGLLAHEMGHAVLDAPHAPPSVIFRQTNRTTVAAPTPVAQSAVDRLAAYPHLVRALESGQMAQIQRVLDAAARLGPLQREMETKYSGAAAYVSENRPKIEALQRRISGEAEVVAKGSDVYVPAERLLADDILPNPNWRGDKGSSEVDATYRQTLYRQLISHPIRVHVDVDAQPPYGRFIDLRWGPNNWQIPHDGGLIRFRDLMQVQQFSMPYMLALEKRRIELELKILEGQREAGKIMVGAEGKKVGEIYRTNVWNMTVKLGRETGRIRGYFDDSKGKAEMYADLARIPGSQVVVKDGEWLHIFALNPDLKSTEFNPIPGQPQDQLYLLEDGNEVAGIQLIETADHIVMQHGGKGWYVYGGHLTAIEEFAVGAIFGDAWEDPSVASTLGQIFVGVIPVVGQIADARDVAIGVHKMWETGGKDGKVQTALALIGFIPLLGDAIKAARGAGKKAVAKAIEEAAPAAEKALARELAQDSARVAERFGAKEATAAGKAAAKSLEELSAKAMAEGGQALAEYAGALRKTFDDVGGNAAALVSVRGGKWKDVAKELSRIVSTGDPETRKVAQALADDMQLWRVRAFKEVESDIGKEAEQAAAALGRDVEPPHMQPTGTKGFASDFDVNLMGPDASLHKSMAARRMEQQFGENWKDLLHADFFVDATRIHAFEKLERGAARRVEKALTKESELNVLAKMMEEGAEPARLEKYAKQLGVDLKGAEFTARRAELTRLAANPTERLALELKMDALHGKFLKEADPAVKEGLAQEMAKTQSLLNAAAKEAYVTPGGVAKQVTRREGMEGLKQLPYRAMTPRMGYMAVLDDLAMLEGTIAKGVREEAAEELSAGTVKSLSKYADRMMVTAGQYGADFSKANKARQAFDEISETLRAARRDPTPLLIEGKATPMFKETSELVKSQLDDLVKQVRAHAGRWTAEMAATEAKETAEAVLKAVKALDDQRSRFIEIVSIVERNLLRATEERRQAKPTGAGQGGASGSGPVDAGAPSAGVP